MPRKPSGESPKRTPPTTVRFRPELLEWLKKVAGPIHPEGVSGVVNDAVAAHRDECEAKSRRIIDGVLGHVREQSPPAE